MYKVVVIGIGNLGKRHVQSLLKSSLEMTIYCVDKMTTNFDEIKQMERIGTKELIFSEEFDGLPSKLDIAIIATSSAVRREVFDELLAVTSVDSIIFEKVLFQKEDDYYYVEKKLKEKNIKAWVNCARREWRSWQQLQNELSTCKDISINVVGSNWGLGCNSIHQFDLVRFFDPTAHIVSTEFNNIIDSKRTGYKELFGTISGIGEKCRSFTISCINGNELNMIISIYASDKLYVINEGKNICQIINISDGTSETKEFKMEYQSGLTQREVEEILNNEKVYMPTYEESMEEHLEIIRPMTEFFEENGGEKKLCPVT